VEFASVVDAVHCAVEVQQAVPERETGIAAGVRIAYDLALKEMGFASWEDRIP
jgi:hypothetical protein